MRVKRILLCVAGILPVLVVGAIGCGSPAPEPQPSPPFEPTPNGYVPGIQSPRWLTEAEKEEIIGIALATPEAVSDLEQHGSYRASVRWVAIVWEGDHASSVYGLNYESVDNVPDNIPESAEFYAEVEIYFGEPERILLYVAINPDTGEVAYLEVHGLKQLS